jgi:uncharacterized membrane protein YbaN (DUF454 family)
MLIGGIAGVLLPVIPGAPMLVLAVALLGPDHPLIKTWMKRLDRLRDYGKKRWEREKRRVRRLHQLGGGAVSCATLRILCSFRKWSRRRATSSIPT